MKFLRFVLVTIFILATPQVVHASDALTPEKLQVEWNRVLIVAPALRTVSIKFGIEQRNGRYAGITTCLDYPRCSRLYVGIIDGPRWQHALWHESGHVLHWSLHWLHDDQFNGFMALIPEQELNRPIWEVWAESFRNCYSPEASPMTSDLRVRCTYIDNFLKPLSPGGGRSGVRM